MIKRIVYFSILLLVYSCQNKQVANSQDNQDTIPTPVDSTVVEHNAPETIPSQNQTINYIEDEALIPSASYRISEENEIGKMLDKGNWLELYQDKNGYKVAKAQYTLVEEDEEPCSGMPTQTIETVKNSLILFKIPQIKTGNIDTVAFKKRVLSPKQNINFTYAGHSYQLRAEGIDPVQNYYRDLKNPFYRLVLTSNGKEKTILHQTEYNDTVTEILFIGDLDNDGEVDFILSSPRDYEEQRILIILSKDNKQYEATRQFDC